MKKIYIPLCLSCMLLMTGNLAFTKGTSQKKLERHVSQKIEQTADNELQVTAFLQHLAKKDPAKLANFLLEGKFAYVYNESIIYLGLKGTHEVLVISQIEDSDVGTFYYVAHKKGNKVTEESLSAIPNTQGFTTLFEHK